MGNCLVCCKNEIVHMVAIKFPHGVHGMVADAAVEYPVFSKIDDINSWIQSLYHPSTNPYEKWAIYNDQAPNHVTKKGHCKGIVTWNNQTISWLCHSVPHFPDQFTANHVSLIYPNECIYGQSFHYVSFPYTEQLITSIIDQLYVMHANIYCSNADVSLRRQTKMFCKLALTPKITHIAKSPNYHVDIYEELALSTKAVWHVESWIRGQRVADTKNVINIRGISIDDISIHYEESQDHSKWAVTDGEFFMGDLNRMLSQHNRGGGGFHCIHTEMSILLKKIIKE